MLVIFVVCFILARASADPGSCPDVQPMNNFDFNLYTQGKWFELTRYDQLSTESGADCVFFEYSGRGSDVHCTLREIVAKKEQTWDIIVKLTPDAGTKAKLFYNVLKKMENVTAYILYTDYKNYSVNYYCGYDEAKQTKLELAWIKSRTPSFSPEVKAVVDKFIEAHPLLDPKKFKWNSFTHAACLIDV